MDKFSSWSKSSSSLKAVSLIIITMDLTAEQVDQIVALELRKLERDYQQTLAADGRLDQVPKVEGTPCLDAMVAETIMEKNKENEKNRVEASGDGPRNDDEDGSWATDEEDDNEDGNGFQKLQNEDSQEEIGEGKNDDLQRGDHLEDHSPQIVSSKDQCGGEVITKVPNFDNVIIQPREELNIDHKKVQEAMSKIDFPTPEWAKK
jgi:hypothetical protein